MLACPYCGQPAMTHLQKAMLGPARAVACKACGKRLSVHWASMLILLPFFAGGAAALALLPSAWAAAPLIVGAIAMFPIQAYLVPLVGREG